MSVLHKVRGGHILGAMEAPETFKRQIDIEITTTELLALNATAIELVPAPGAGKALILLGAVLFLDYNTTAYDGVAAGEDLTINYTDKTGAVLATIETTGFLDQGTDQVRYVYAASTAAITPVADAVLCLHLLTAEIATGNSPLKLRVYYRVVPTTL
jgi:hypothetical protein